MAFRLAMGRTVPAYERPRPRCADFKVEADIDPGNLCPIHHIKLTREQEDNYYFKLFRAAGAPGSALPRAR